jgi:hypothetical protein
MSYYQGIGGVGDILGAAGNVASDPALPQVVALVTEIKGLSSGGPSRPSTGPSEPGIGLRRIVTPLRAYVAYKRHPWILPAFAGGIVIGIFALGALTGRRRARRTP